MATPRKAVRALKAEFDAAHKQGMAALQRRDFAAVNAAVKQEARILAEQGAVIAEHVHRSERLVAALDKPAAPKRRQKKR